MIIVTLYGKPGCHLCDEARDVLLSVHAQEPFTLREVSILGDDALFAKYAEEIPVIDIDGEFFCQYHVDAAAFARKLQERKQSQ